MMPATDTPRPSAEDRIKAATWFAEQGFGVFSVWGVAPDGACRCPKGAACDNAGKHPIARQGFLENTRDPAVIRTLLSAASEPNYGLVCPDGVFALDVDGEGVARLQQLQDRMGWLPLTLRTNTANGYHIFMRWPADLPRPIGQLFGYVTRWGSGANAGYVIGPRSIHATGAVYTPGEAFTIAERVGRVGDYAGTRPGRHYRYRGRVRTARTRLSGLPIRRDPRIHGLAVHARHLQGRD
jgi:hypothetical protein